MRTAIWLLVIAGVVAYAALRPSDHHDVDPVYAYCAYGANSLVQLQACEDHVTKDQIASKNTHAARFSRGDLESCGPDAGPYCAGIVQIRESDATPSGDLDKDPWQGP